MDGLLACLDLINESTNKVRVYLFLPLLESKQHCRRWPRAYIHEEVEFELFSELSEGANQEWLQMSVLLLL